MRIQYTPNPAVLALVAGVSRQTADRKLAAAWDPGYVKDRSSSVYTTTSKVMEVINKKFPRWSFEGAGKDGFSISTTDEALGGIAGPLSEDVTEAQQIEAEVKALYPSATVTTDHVDNYFYVNVSGIPITAALKRSGVIRRQAPKVDHQEIGPNPDPTLMVRTPGVGTITFDTTMGETMVSKLKAMKVKAAEDCPFCHEPMFDFSCGCPGEKANVEEYYKRQNELKASKFEVTWTRNTGGRQEVGEREFDTEESAKAFMADLERGNKHSLSSPFENLKIVPMRDMPDRFEVWWEKNDEIFYAPNGFSTEEEAESYAVKKRLKRYNDYGIRDKYQEQRNRKKGIRISSKKN